MADGDPARVVTGGVDGTDGLPVVSDPANPPAAAQVTVDASSLLPATELTITLSIDQGASASNTVETGEAFLIDSVDVEVAPMVLGARDARADGFVYDEAGRMVSRTVDGVSTALVWDVMSNLVESDGAGGHVVYVYDASGQRVAQVGLSEGEAAGSATAYVGGGQVTDPDTSMGVTGDTTATRYYTFGGATVAVRTDDGQLALMLGDEQGSTSVMMPVVLDGSGAMVPAVLADVAGVVRTAYTPYGQLRGADNVAVDRGWLGQVEDTGTGLTYLNARYYDPALQRFLSPDPLMNPGDPRTLDAYRYAENNPVVFTDASGLFAACSGVSGAAEAACLKSYYGGRKQTPPTPGKATTSRVPDVGPGSRPSYWPQPATSGDIVQTFPITPSPGGGQVSIGAFITSEYAGAHIGWMGTLGELRSRGDNRNFDPSLTWTRSRFAVLIDYEEGLIHMRMAPSCHDAKRRDCVPAEPGGVHIEEVKFAETEEFRVKMCINAGPHPYTCGVGSDGLDPNLWRDSTALRINYSKSNPAVNWAPSLDLDLTISPGAGGEAYVSVWGDVYPSIEAYRISPDGQIHTIIQSEQFLGDEPLGAGALVFPETWRVGNVG